MISIPKENGLYSINEKLIHTFTLETNKKVILLKINPHSKKINYSFDLTFDYEEGKLEAINKQICDSINEIESRM